MPLPWGMDGNSVVAATTPLKKSSLPSVEVVPVLQVVLEVLRTMALTMVAARMAAVAEEPRRRRVLARRTRAWRHGQWEMCAEAEGKRTWGASWSHFHPSRRVFPVMPTPRRVGGV